MEDKFWELATKYFANEASEEDVHQLLGLLKLNKNYKKKFDELAYQWNITDKIVHSTFNAYRSKRKISLAVVSSSARKNNKSSKKLIFNIAAILILIVGVGMVVKFLAFPSDKWDEYATNNNQHLKVILPDSSIVWLNKNSSLAYNFNNKSARLIRLKGEGFFKVKRDTLKPFIVQSNHLITKVLGTSFNIKANNSNEEKVSVISGQVTVSSNPKYTIILEKGEQASYNKESDRLHKLKIHNILNTITWQSKVFDFDNITIEEAFNYLSDAYDVSFKYSNNKIKKCIIKASFKSQSLETILNIICTSIDCKYEIIKNENEIILSGMGC